MKLDQIFERNNRIPNPLLKGEIDYDAMDDFDDIENDCHAAFHYAQRYN